MSIVKDLLFILTAITGLFYILYLNKNISAQKKYFLNTLKHDIKVPLLAQINALKLLNNADNPLTEAMKESCQNTLEMLNMLICLYERRNPKKDFIIISELLNSVFQRLNKVADSKNIDFYCYTDKDVILKTDKTSVEALIYNLLLMTIYESPQNCKVACITKSGMLGIKIKIFSNYSSKSNEKSICSTLNPVGYNIMTELCRHYIKENRWLMIENINKYNVKSFTIYIPQYKGFFSPICTSIQYLRHNMLELGKSVL